VLSLALRLRKRNNGANHTHNPKNVAISPNVGDFTMGPPRYALCAACRASCVMRVKWKNHMKWSTTTRMQDAMNVGEEREMTGHECETFCKYTTWQNIENAIF
jgi:hypothetical protein